MNKTTEQNNSCKKPKQQLTTGSPKGWIYTIKWTVSTGFIPSLVKELRALTICNNYIYKNNNTCQYVCDCLNKTFDTLNLERYHPTRLSTLDIPEDGTIVWLPRFSMASSQSPFIPQSMRWTKSALNVKLLYTGVVFSSRSNCKDLCHLYNEIVTKPSKNSL